MELETQEIRDLILGKIKYRKCPCCDNKGREYYDDTTSEGRYPSPSGINPANLDSDECENCKGLAYILYYNNEGEVYVSR